MTDIMEPVRDWTGDFDIFEPEYVVSPERRWSEQRERCPIAFTERRQRTWLPVRYQDLSEIAHDVETFSSSDVAVVSIFREGESGSANFSAPPITSDPPVHTWARRLLLPSFGPSAVDRMTPITRGLANDLIDEFIDNGKADAARDYAQHIPVRVIAMMLGIPLEDEDRFTGGWSGSCRRASRTRRRLGGRSTSWSCTSRPGWLSTGRCPRASGPTTC